MVKEKNHDDIDKIIVPSSYDLTRIDMTGTIFEKEYLEKPLVKGYKDVNKEEIPFFNFKEFKEAFDRRIQYITKEELADHQTLGEKILHVLTCKRYRNGSLDTINVEKYGPKFLEKINQSIKQGLPIEVMLPAFPFKIRNPLKSQRADADLAEVGSFLRFHEICMQIKNIYPAGGRFVIFHDGHLYYKHFLNSLSDAERYLTSLGKFLKELNLKDEVVILDAKEELKKIKGFDKIYEEARKEMQNMWAVNKANEKVQKILNSATMNLNLSNIPYETLYHVLVYDDWDLSKDEKALKETIRQKADKTTFEYMTVQHALEKANFFDTMRPLAVRATVHPKEGQIGLFLVKNKTHLLPWMGVGVLKSDGTVSVHYEHALIEHDKYYPVFIKGEKFPFYYKEAEVIYEGIDQFKKLFYKVIADLGPSDSYWAFAFKMEYYNDELSDFLKEVHTKLMEKKVQDRLLGSKQVENEIRDNFKNNGNIQLRFTDKTTPVGVIILKDRIIHLLWGDNPSAYEIVSKQIVEQYRKFFEEMWTASDS